MNKNMFLSITLVCISFLFLTGCQQEELTESKSLQYDKRVYELSDNPEVQAELQFMKDHMGEDLSKITIIQIGKWKGDYIHREDRDAVIIPRINITEELQKYLDKETVTTSQLQRHRRHTMMATAGAKNIRHTTINNISVPSTWRTAINTARSGWNSLGRSLTFNMPANGSALSSHTVNVSYRSFSALFGPLNITDTAISRLPATGETIGSELIINSDMDAVQNLSARQKTFVMAHELGHSIGFRHTDSQDGTLIYTGNWVCDGSSDSSSIMRAGTSPVPSWPISGTGFSLCDQLAFSNFYGLV